MAGVRPDALVFTGSPTEHGTPGEYQQLRALPEATSTPAVFAVGNHDDRSAMREHLLGADPAMELQNRGELAAAIAGTDVPIVPAGHTHVVSAGAVAGGAPPPVTSRATSEWFDQKTSTLSRRSASPARRGSRRCAPPPPGSGPGVAVGRGA